MAKITITEENKPTPEEFRRMLEEAMAKSNPVDELIELSHELYELEQRYGMSSAEFYDKYQKGKLGDDEDVMHWAILYDSFLRRKQLLEAALIREAVWRTHEITPA
ncbi:MAG: hypothetical protein ACE5NP_07655 [Anaerolineae bacterium]